jgi:two-component system, NarL family, nitrate/nitrite response regulator NarL
MTNRSNVVLVDPQPLFRHGVAHALANMRSFSIVGQGATADDAVSLATKHAPDLAFVNIDASDSGLATVERIAEASPKTRTILLTSLDGRDFVERAFHVGVSAYLLKNIEVSELCQAAAAVIAGEIYVSRKLVSRLFNATEARPSKLTSVSFSEREEQILRLLTRGMSNKSIAFELSISEKTAKYYLTTIMKKLQAKNRVEVALFAAARVKA